MHRGRHNVVAKVLVVFFPNSTSTRLCRFQVKALLWLLLPNQFTNQLHRLCCSKFGHRWNCACTCKNSSWV